ncbi:MAG: hypothetical protein GKR99_14165 [Rhodobacteraceae bacterium]|nr:hypothetical protein [Paracoccaceae bacterium]
MNDEGTPQADIPGLRLLRWLVTGLTATMIVGLLAIVAMLVIIVNRDSVSLPDQISLPDGVEARALTIGPSWLAVVTSDDRILIYDDQGERLLQEVTISGAQP